MNSRLALIAALVVCTFAPRAVRAEEGQLWEVTTHMDVSKVKELQGHDVEDQMTNTHQMCRGKDEREAITKSDMRKCKVQDLKEDGLTVTMRFDCEDGSGSMKMVYNKARTSYKGTVQMHDANDHDLAMTMEGKKIGECDPAKARAERKQRRDNMMAQSEMIKARVAESNKMMETGEIENCEKAVENMQPEGLGFYGQCRHKKDDANCKNVLPTMEQQNPKVYKACSKSADEFCKRLNTPEGYYKLGQSMRMKQAEEMCGVDADDLKPKLCKSAVKDEFWAFVGANCPEDAKPLAKKHCAGRSYTIKEGDPKAMEKKWYNFCVAVAGKNMAGEETAASEDSGSKGSKDSEEEQPEDAKGVAKKAAKKAVVEGLKGLFGR